MRNNKNANLKKTRKGMTLVEVLVSITIFAIISLALVTSYIGLMNMTNLQDDYVRLEMVAYDINYYWDKFGKEWDDKYFGSDCDTYKRGYLKYVDGVIVPTTDPTAPFTVSYEYKDDQLIISIFTSDRKYVSKLSCGKSAKEEATP